MLIEMHQNTLANMTAALEYVCMNIPEAFDTSETRRMIAEGIMACARNGHFLLPDLKEAGQQALNDIISPPKKSWFNLF